MFLGMAPRISVSVTLAGDAGNCTLRTTALGLSKCVNVYTCTVLVGMLGLLLTLSPQQASGRLSCGDWFQV